MILRLGFCGRAPYLDRSQLREALPMNIAVRGMANVAVAAEMKGLLNFMDRIRDMPAEEQLDEIRRWIDETIRGVNDGWF